MIALRPSSGALPACEARPCASTSSTAEPLRQMTTPSPTCPRFQAKHVVMLCGQLLNQFLRTGRAGFLIAVKQAGYLREVAELPFPQQLHRVQAERHAPLAIRYARTIGPLPVCAERARCCRAGRKHRVHMSHGENFAAAGSFKYTHHVKSGVRLVRRHEAYLGPQLPQERGGEIPHPE